MMRLWLWGALILSCGSVFWAGMGICSDENMYSRAFIDGVRYYETGDYAAAIENFETISAAGIRNGKLFYNLGNAYLKKGDIGPAILWYERARKIMPGDPDLQFNLTYAGSLVKDEDEEKSSPVWDVLFFWKDMVRLSALQWAGIVVNAVFWILLGAYHFYRKSALRHACYGAIFFSILILGTAGWRIVEKNFYREAVILPTSVSVRSGFASSSTELFVLHEGTKVRVEKQIDNFLKIRFSENKIGWVPTEVAGVI